LATAIQKSVTASIAVMAPRAVTTTVSVAVEFGRAGHGWAGAVVFNLWLRRQLRERRMSQRQLSAFSGVHHSTISRLIREQRSPTLAVATRLARALRKANGDDDASTYFARLSEETIFPTARVEMALRGDDELDDDDVRTLMETYLVARARARRRRARQASATGTDAQSTSPAEGAAEAELPAVRQHTARQGRVTRA